MDDAQISDISLRVLSLLVQLFGGENKHSLDPENLVMFWYNIVCNETKTMRLKILNVVFSMPTFPQNIELASMNMYLLIPLNGE